MSHKLDETLATLQNMGDTATGRTMTEAIEVDYGDGPCVQVTYEDGGCAVMSLTVFARLVIAGQERP